MKWIEPIVSSKSSRNLVYRRTDGQTDRHQGESSIPPFHLWWSGGIKSCIIVRTPKCSMSRDYVLWNLTECSECRREILEWSGNFKVFYFTDLLIRRVISSWIGPSRGFVSPTYFRPQGPATKTVWTTDIVPWIPMFYVVRSRIVRIICISWAHIAWMLPCSNSRASGRATGCIYCFMVQ